MAFQRAGWSVAAALLLLAGCATVPRPPPAADPAAALAAREARLAAVERWSAAGRMALQAGDEGWNVSVRWQQDGNRYRIRLSGPFGQGTVELEGEPGRVVLRTGDEAPLVSSDPEHLLERAVGWQVPVAGLRYWLMGLSAPGVPITARELDAAGRPLRLVQSGWRVSYERYSEDAGIALPARLSLENPRLSARMVVTRWELGA